MDNLHFDYRHRFDASISYVLPQPPFDLTEGSIFQGFAPGTLATAGFVEILLKLPATCLEFVGSRERIILARSLGYGRYRIIPLESNVLSALPISPERPFWCVFSDERSIESVVEFLQGIEHPVLHVTSMEDDDVPHVSEVNRQMILEYARNTLAFLSGDLPEINRANWLRSSPDWKANLPEELLDVVEWGHNATKPNNAALESLGYTFRSAEPLHGNDLERYAAAISDGTATVRRIRDAALGAYKYSPFGLGPATGFVITAPSVFRYLYRSTGLWREFEQKLGKKCGRFVRDFVTRRSGFSNTISTKDANKILSSNEVQAFVVLRQQELNAYTAALSAIAASDFTPVIRLSPAVERFHGLLRDIANCSRGNSPHQTWKLNKLVGRLTQGLIAAIGPRTMDELSKNHGDAKILADIPLEWLPIDGVPLAIRNSSSRVPTTPGNLFFGECLARDNMWMPRSMLDEILIIRSFKDDDPLRNVLKQALGRFFDGQGLDCEVRLVDVETTDELVDALNGYQGGLLIFDGHGSSAGDEDVAGLVIGGKTVNCWELRGRARIPPIVLLSSCDTHPVDGSHASAANGFIAAGAQTVLGTLLPIRADHAAMFICRFLLRIDEYVKLATRHAGAIRWNDVVGGFQRMVYLTDLLDMLTRYGHIVSDAMWHRIHVKGNTYINNRDTQWWEKIKTDIEANIGVGATMLKDLQLESLQLSQALIYVQIGNPEKIIIVDEHWSAPGLVDTSEL